jgi:uncharacterized membrane protein YoaK (UPF0700 family)
MKREETRLAAIKGFLDTLSCLALFRPFTAHVTGNFMLPGGRGGCSLSGRGSWTLLAATNA